MVRVLDLKRVSATTVSPTSSLPWPEYPPLTDDIRMPSLDASASMTNWPMLFEESGNFLVWFWNANLCLVIGYGKFPNPAIKRCGIEVIIIFYLVRVRERLPSFWWQHTTAISVYLVHSHKVSPMNFASEEKWNGMILMFEYYCIVYRWQVLIPSQGWSGKNTLPMWSTGRPRRVLRFSDRQPFEILKEYQKECLSYMTFLRWVSLRGSVRTRIRILSHHETMTYWWCVMLQDNDFSHRRV